MVSLLWMLEPSQHVGVVLACQAIALCLDGQGQLAGLRGFANGRSNRCGFSLLASAIAPRRLGLGLALGIVIAGWGTRLRVLSRSRESAHGVLIAA
jgi:hypothetical protein